MIHILVVDDDAKLNKTVCTYLNDCGFEAKGVLFLTSGLHTGLLVCMDEMNVPNWLQVYVPIF